MKVRRIGQFTGLLAALLLLSCGRNRDYNPDNHLTAEERRSLIAATVRFMATTPDGISPEDRHSPIYDGYYHEQENAFSIQAFWTEGNWDYLLVRRRYTSPHRTDVGIGIKLIVDENGLLSYYEEVFRTWKMEADSLTRRGPFLFNLMVNEEDLTPYYSSRSGNTDYIEFPDDRTYFDTNRRIWRTK